MSSTTIYNSANIKFVSSVCSSGKSYSLEQYTKSNHQNRNHLIVVPTLKLADQYHNNLTALNIDALDISKINSETTNGKPVSGEITKYINNSLDDDHILIITFQSYEYLEYFPNKDNWDIFIDELPQLDSFLEFDISKNKQLITDFFELDESINDKISTLKIKEHSRHLLKQAYHSNDDAYNCFKNFYRMALFGNRTTFVDKQNWNDVINKKVTANKSGKIYILCLYNPNLFSRTTILGANIEDSLLYKWLVKFHNANFQPHNELIKNLRYTEHNDSFGQQVNINYFIENRHYSKYLRNDNLLGEQMDSLAINLIGDNKTLFVGNNDYKSPLDQLENVARISVKSHGMNEYDDFNNIYLNLALNMTPFHNNMLKNLGFDNEDIKISVTFENYYQLIMRTSLRNIDTNKQVNIYVPDQLCAEYMGQLLCTDNINYQAGLDVKPSLIPLTSSQVNNRSSFKKTMDKLFNHPVSHKKLPLFTNIKLDSNELIEINNINDNQIAFTCHKNHKAIKQSEFVNGVMDIMKFVNLLKKSSNHITTGKDDGILINSTIFESNEHNKGYRLQDNFVSGHFMILDFDNGNLSPKQFEKIFWNKEKHSFVITNSYSRSNEQPNRFRVFMFYKKPVYSIEQHKAVYQYITNTLKNNGFDNTESKLDPACGSGNQSFYLPCTNQQYQTHSFYRKHGCTRIADIQKYGLDTNNIIKTTLKTKEFNHYTKIKADDDVEHTVNKLINEIKLMTSDRHQPFFDAAIQMRSLGLSKQEIESNCYIIAGDDQHMKNKVNGIVSSLERYH